MQSIDPVDLFFARAKSAGVPMSLICERAKVAQSTPSRWKKNRNSANLATLNQLEDALASIIAPEGQR